MKEIKAIELKSYKEKSIGLIKNRDYPILFKSRFGIHTFLIKNETFVYILSPHKGYYKIFKSKMILPNRIFFWNPKYNLVLESREDLNLHTDDLMTLELLST